MRVSYYIISRQDLTESVLEYGLYTSITNYVTIGVKMRQRYSENPIIILDISNVSGVIIDDILSIGNMVNASDYEILFILDYIIAKGLIEFFADRAINVILPVEESKSHIVGSRSDLSDIVYRKNRDLVYGMLLNKPFTIKSESWIRVTTTPTTSILVIGNLNE